jgi:hypothetical protein
LSGDISGYQDKILYGDCSHLKGCMTGIFGNCTGKHGDIGDCMITDAERAEGIDIEDLVEE